MGFNREPDQPVVNIIYYPLEVIVEQTLTNAEGLAPTVLMRVGAPARSDWAHFPPGAVPVVRLPC
ncbi:hypothetical protein TSMEX_006342 [Taenia solium]|eukprot:TsM_001206800 transcript=TsM_001206800 gene=TsM_001206800